MIPLSTAAQLLDFGSRIGAGPRADDQLRGAVAIHNILTQQGVAYLADEVGMGKTYVALGALALFRHFDPQFRVLFIAPRANIQQKWMKELRNFVTHNVRYPDLRIKAIDERPARPLVSCENLMELVEEASIDPNRDFFARLTSFSFAVGGRDGVDAEVARKVRGRLKTFIPWLADDLFDLRNKQAFKDNVARAVCAALPTFDLVVIDEAHNLKHGWSEHGAARNRVLSLVLGRSGEADPKSFPSFGPRAKRVLFLSATPIDETYRQLWNQLDLVGRSGPFAILRTTDTDTDSEAKKKAAARSFLVRRVTTVSIAGTDHTKNQYRREWRSGGVDTHDQAIEISDVRQRLVVALVQKKVSELLQSERFGASFQVGMLASFESFLETAGVKKDDDESVFDDAEQTDDEQERDGIDVLDVNKLARSYRERFGQEPPHPKMDALVARLSHSWEQGEKSLVFVRRVASVTELKRKLDDRYDDWLIGRLRRELPANVQDRLERIVNQYNEVKLAARRRNTASQVSENDDNDKGGRDTFFAWFFRGDGPQGVVSGANIQQRFTQVGTTYATFFGDNYVADLLGCSPSEAQAHLAQALGMETAALREELRRRSRRFLSPNGSRTRADRFEAVQAAAVEMLQDHHGPFEARARLVWRERFASSAVTSPVEEAPDIGDWLHLRTFFTELRERPALRERLWPSPAGPTDLAAFRTRELRAELLASAARLGHSLVDLYVMTISRLGSLEHGAKDHGEEAEDVALAQIHEFLDLLEQQRTTPVQDRGWRAFDELADIAEHFELILDVNAPEAREQPLAETTKEFAKLLRRQQPIGGMAGQVNATLVRQFRMPGYPLVLITTDLLQEGEDLHTFCSSVHHYGISWTPSSMEQRIGRIDRVRSHSDRRLSGLTRQADGAELLQVYFPHLKDTVEVLQVQRVLERMNVFLRLMHEGLTTAGDEEKKINVPTAILREQRAVAQITERLQTAFPIEEERLQGTIQTLAVLPEHAQAIEERFRSLARTAIPNLDVVWEPDSPRGSLYGTVLLGARRQPFVLRLQSLGERLCVRCISPVGRVGAEDSQDEIRDSVARRSIRLGAVPSTDQESTYDLTVEEDTLLADQPESDAQRLSALLRRVAEEADALEQRHLPGKDQALSAFREQLNEELARGR